MKNNSLNKKIAKFILFLIPVIVLFDWLMNLGIVNLQIGLYLKGLSILIFISIIRKNTSSNFFFKKHILYFLSLFVIYSIVSDKMIENLYFTARIAYWIFGSIAFFSLLQNENIKNESLRKMLVLTVIIATVFTIILMRDSDEHQNASAYLLLWSLPLLLHFKKKTIVKFAVVFALIGIIITIKRGAIIALLASLFVYFIADTYINKGIINRVKVVLTAALVSGVAIFVMFSQWDMISKRLEDKGGSGRDIMYEVIIDDYLNSDLTNIIFGHGVNSVQKLTARKLAGDPNSAGVAAHSDWLQNAYDFGLFGIFFMLVMHFKLLKMVRFFQKNKSNLFPTVAMLYTIFFLTTIYSFILSYPQAIFLGLTLAYISSERVNIISRKQIIIGNH